MDEKNSRDNWLIDLMINYASTIINTWRDKLLSPPPFFFLTKQSKTSFREKKEKTVDRRGGKEYE